MAKRQPKMPTITLVEKDALVLLHGLDFLLSMDLKIIRPGNWRASEWAMVVGGWRQSAKVLKEALDGLNGDGKQESGNA